MGRAAALARGVWLAGAVAACSADLDGLSRPSDAGRRDAWVETIGARDRDPASDSPAPMDAAPDGEAGGADAAIDGAGETDTGVEPPRCVSSGGLWFSPPQPVPGIAGLRGVA